MLAIYTSISFSTVSGLALAPGATIEVRREDTNAIATIYSDEAGTTPKANPFTSDLTTGAFSFYAEGLKRGYKVKSTFGAEVIEVRNQPVGNAAQVDISDFGEVLINAADAAEAQEVMSLLSAPGDFHAGGASGVVQRASASPVPINLAIACSVAGNALTIALKGKDLNDPSPTNPVLIPFRNVTPGTGDYTWLAVTAATSLVVSSGSTLGTANSVPFRFWLVGFNDGNTFRLGIINCVSTSAGAGSGRNVTSIFPLRGWTIASSTTEGGLGAADSAQVFYTGTAVAAKAYSVLGYVTYEAGLATAGSYASVPSRVHVLTRDTPLPGDIIQVQRTQTGAVATGTTTIPLDDTIPQQTEGDQYLSQTITPSSEANVLGITASLQLSSSASNNHVVALFQDAIANALAAMWETNSGAGSEAPVSLQHLMLADTASATTFKIRAGGNNAGTTTLNGRASGRFLAAVAASSLEITEMMG